MNYRFYNFIDHLLENGFEKIGHGSFRDAYARGNVVIKVPSCEDGLIDNMVEARGWRTYKKRRTQMGLFVAPCRLLPNGCLMMMRVQIIEDDDPILPGWADLVDNRQVGLYKRRCVAYDFALDLIERHEWEKEWNVRSDFFYSNEWKKRDRPSLKLTG